MQGGADSMQLQLLLHVSMLHAQSTLLAAFEHLSTWWAAIQTNFGTDQCLEIHLHFEALISTKTSSVL